jgi:hypothetical protein
LNDHATPSIDLEIILGRRGSGDRGGGKTGSSIVAFPEISAVLRLLSIKSARGLVGGAAAGPRSLGSNGKKRNFPRLISQKRGKTLRGRPERGLRGPLRMGSFCNGRKKSRSRPFSIFNCHADSHDEYGMAGCTCLCKLLKMHGEIVVTENRHNRAILGKAGKWFCLTDFEGILRGRAGWGSKSRGRISVRVVLRSVSPARRVGNCCGPKRRRQPDLDRVACGVGAFEADSRRRGARLGYAVYIVGVGVVPTRCNWPGFCIYRMLKFWSLC